LPLHSSFVIRLTLVLAAQAFRAAASSQETCSRPQPGNTITAPAELRSSGQLLSVQLAFRQVTGPDGRALFCYIDEKGNQSPTLRVKPGNTVVIKLKNEAPPGGAPGHSMGARQNSCSGTASGTPMSVSSTNLHFHGLNLAPRCHQDDVLGTLIQPAETPFEYRFKIPLQQPPGLYWYHPHAHGFSEGQVLGGASGALIVEGIERVQPVAAGLPERILILRDQPIPAQHTTSGDFDDAVGRDISVNFVPVRFPLYLPAVMEVKPNEREIWRVLNASADTYFDLQVIYVLRGKRAAQHLQVIAVDGYPADKFRGKELTDVTTVLIPPGGRAEFIVTTPQAGAFAQLISRDYDTGQDGARNPRHVIANMVSRISAPALPALPALTAAGGPPRSDPAHLPDAAPVRVRRLYFSENRQDLKDPLKPALYFITVEGKTPAVFDMHSGKPDIVVRQGAVEDWIIENRATEAHVFHIHQLHFRVVERNGEKVNEPVLRDTVDLPSWDGKSAKYPSVRLRMDFRNPDIIGTFVYHCHILEHEDAGMMGSIRVVGR
jgi:FtsP/CotA-like multicopper oxidase with cupredoxin domain